MTETMIDLDAFKAFELAGWADAELTRQYETGASRVTVQSAGPLLQAARVRPGMRVLDVATGPGDVAAAAAAAGADVVGVDFSAAMVALARGRHPEVEFREGDAEALPFPEGVFDAVTMNYGLLHLARPEQGIAEAWRVLRPGGRFAFTVWSPPAPSNGFGILLGAIRAVGNPDVPVPPGPPIFRFSDPEESTRALRDAGFVDITVTDVVLTWELPSADAFLAALAEGSVRMRAMIRGQTQEDLAEIRREMREAVIPHATEDGIEVPMSAVLAVGRKP